MHKALFILVAALLVAVSCSPPATHVEPTLTMTVISEPSGAAVLMDNREVGVTPYAISALAGTHFIELKLDGYERWWRPLPKAADAAKEMKVKLRAVTAAIMVTSTPTGVSVMQDGAELGITPFIIAEHAVGVYTVEYRMPGYAPRRKDYKIETAQPQEVTVVLTSIMAILEVYTQPVSASVLIDNVPKGTTPADRTEPLVIRSIQAGKYNVKVMRAGYSPKEQTILLRRSTTARADFILEPLPGAVKIWSKPTGAQVFTGKKLLGKTPITVTDLPIGKFSFSVRLPDHDAYRSSIEIVSDTTKQVSVTLRKNVGTIDLATIPAGTSVYVDGRIAGKTEAGDDSTEISIVLTLDGLKPGRHRIRIEHPAYEPIERIVVVERAQVTTMGTLKLKKRWIPDYLLIKAKNNEKVKGILLKHYHDGSIQFESPKGVSIKYFKEEIKQLIPLRK